MSIINFEEEVRKIKLHKQGNNFALNKPLLLLLVLSKIKSGHVNSFVFDEVKDDLKKLLIEFGNRDSAPISYYPFLFLTSSPNIWICSKSKSDFKNPDSPSKAELEGMSGSLNESFYKFLLKNDNLNSIVTSILNQHWNEHQQLKIRQFLKFDLQNSTKVGTQVIHPLALELQKLRESSKHAVAHGASIGLDDFREYLHIEREVELKLKERVQLCAQVDKAQLLLVCGNVGDGKSHIISHLNKGLKDEMAQFKIHNDATESHNPNERSNQTLFKLLEAFQDENIERCKEKIILAINLGTLSNFLDEYGDKFNRLIRYVDDHNILDTDVVSDDDPGDGYFQHVNFTDYHMYSLTSVGPKSKIVTTLLERIVSDDPKNLIFEAYKKSKEIGIDNCPICLNYEFLQIKCNRDALVELVIQAIVKNKLIISLRALLNFFYDLLVPIDFKWEEIDSYKKQLSELKTSALLNAIIPNYIFEHPELSVVFDKMSRLDPCSLRYSALDLELIRLINSETPEKIFTDFIGTDSLSIVTNQLSELSKEKISAKVKNDTLTKSFIRLNFFSNHKDVMAKSDPYYLDYMTTLFEYNNHRKLALERIFNIVREAARKWYGDPNKRDKVVLRVGKKQSKYRVFKAFKAKPVIDKVPENENEELIKFVQEFTLRFNIDGAEDVVKIHIDYGLYKILNQINSGYLPNRRDNNNYLSFVGLINRLINQNNETSDLEIDTVNIGKASDFKLSKDDFGNYKFQTL